MQQINLYTDDFKPKKVVLPLEQLILIPIIVLVLLAGVTVWLQAGLGDTEKKLGKLEQKNDSMQSRLQSLEEKAKKQRKDDGLVAANRRLSKTLKARQQMMDMLDTVVVKDDEGFSSLLLSLARQNIDDLWLKKIYVGAAGKDMRLEGTTLKANTVPEYLQKLRKEPSFIGRSFTLFELDKHPDNSAQLNFSLRSEISHLKQDVALSPFERTLLKGDSSSSENVSKGENDGLVSEVKP